MPKDASGGCMEKWLSYMVFCLRPPSSLTIFITAVKSELFLENMVRVFVCDHLLSCVHLFVTPWTVACQAPLSMGFTRQDYWSGLPFPSPITKMHTVLIQFGRIHMYIYVEMG